VQVTKWVMELVAGTLPPLRALMGDKLHLVQSQALTSDCWSGKGRMPSRGKQYGLAGCRLADGWNDGVMSKLSL
jgi:hypothetical protein